MGLCEDAANEVTANKSHPENMETNREASAASTSSRVTEMRRPLSNTSLLAEMDLSTSVDESFEASGTTQEGANFDTELHREDRDRQSAEAVEGSTSPPVPIPHDTDWREPGLRKKKKKWNGRLKPCDICGKLISAGNMSKHQRRATCGLNKTNPPSLIKSFDISRLLSKESRVTLENINLTSMRITPDDPCKGRMKIALDKEELGTYKIHQISKKGRQKQTCPFCGKIVDDRYNLIRHCSVQHFRSHLMKFVKKGSYKCSFCGQDKQNVRLPGLLGHIGGVHKREEIESLIRGDDRVDICQDSRQNEDMVSQSSPDIGHTENQDPTCPQHEEDNQNKCLSNSEPPSVNENNDHGLECFIDDCNFETSKRMKLYRHYSTEHYRRQLVEHLKGEDSTTCKFCNILIRKTSDMIAHIGSVHGKVEQYIPEEHRIPLTAKSVPSNSIDDKLKNKDKNENDENSNSVKDERSPSPAGQIISVETVALPEILPSSINPDDECLVDLKIEVVESVQNSSLLQEVNTESKEYSQHTNKVTEVDLRRVLDSDSEDSDNE